MRQLVAELPEREGRILAIRFGLVDGVDATLEETMRAVGLNSRERVRQLEHRAMRTIKERLRKRGIKTARAFIEDPPSPNV